MRRRSGIAPVRFLTRLLLLPLVVFACSGTNGSGGRVGVDTLENGALLVTNSREGIWSPDDAWRAVEETRIGSADDTDTLVIFGNIWDVTLDSYHRILQLSPQGSQVRLVTSPPSDILDGYGELGTITCSKGLNARGLESNVVQCQNELRNKTGALGGVLVVITGQQLGGQCGNCVTMVATSYGRTRR